MIIKYWIFVLQYVRLGFTKIDAIDSSEPMLRKAAERNIYRNIICDRLGSNKLNIESGKLKNFNASLCKNCRKLLYVK